MALNFDLYYHFLQYSIENNKFIPKNTAIIKHINKNEITNFYARSKEWQDVLKNYTNKWEDRLNALGEVAKSNTIENLFKVSSALGIFQEGENGIRAKKFVLEEILKMAPNEIHNNFSGLDTHKNGYNEEFAKFYIKNYRHAENEEYKFLEKANELETGDVEIKNYTSAVYNNWNKVKEAFPNKSVFADRERGSENNNLTEADVVNAVSIVIYQNVHKGCEELAELSGKYGYTQSMFEELQRTFEQGKEIKPDEMILKIAEDDMNKKVSYKFLPKDSVEGLFIGEKTNCCQTVHDAGAECLRYGATKPNSGFIAFYSGNRLIGQSWVWYNEKTGVVCLDNIEVPRIWQKHLKKEEFKNEFLNCIKRLSTGIKQDMEKSGKNVSQVTIGAGYNDLPGIESFEAIDVTGKKTLPDNYNNYSDAKEVQYLVSSFKEKVKEEEHTA